MPTISKPASPQVCLALFLIVTIGTVPVLAQKKNVTSLELEWDPQQTVGEAEVDLRPFMRNDAVRLVLEDARAGLEPSRIGTRTDDDDRLYELTATNPVLAFVEERLRLQLLAWGVKLSDSAALIFAGKLMDFTVDETNRAVGASYVATVRLAFELQSESGAVLWTGAKTGDATRYGRKFSNRNCNEVLSDALLEAFAETLSDDDLRLAWASKDTPQPAARAATASQSVTGTASKVVSSAELLQEVRELTSRGFEIATILEFVNQHVLASRLTAAELGEWQEAGVVEEILRTVIRLPVQEPK